MNFKDKDGNDVFEGDIIEYEEQGRKVGSYLVGFDEETQDPVAGHFILWTVISQSKVVGSQFENSDIITPFGKEL